MIPVSEWDPNRSDVGPSNIINGRLNVANLLDINNPHVSTAQSTLNISVGEKRQIDLETSSGTITYSSSNSNIASVTSTGLVEGVGAGSANIVVTASKNGQTASTNVSVNVAGIVATDTMSFSPRQATLNVGDTINKTTNSLNRYGQFILVGENVKTLIHKQEEINIFLQNQMLNI